MKPEFEMIVDAPMTAEELADFHRRQAQFRENLEWYEAHAGDIGERYAGKFICVAGQEVFAGETSLEARAKARAAHPDDAGAFGEYVRTTKGPIVYARHR